MTGPEIEERQLPRGRIVLITGAGQGIGRVLAHSFAAVGALPVVAGSNLARVQAVASEIRDSGGKATALQVDVGDADSVSAMMRSILDAHSRLDVLINNAAVFSTLKKQPFDEIPLDVWDAVQRVNTTGSFLCARAAAPAMRRQGFGRIINVSSSAVSLGRPNYLHYTTSKAALLGMTRSLARELGPSGITVNSVLPGSVETEITRDTASGEDRVRLLNMQCVPRRQVPADLIGVMLFLASDSSEFMTGQSLAVDGGATHL